MHMQRCSHCKFCELGVESAALYIARPSWPSEVSRRVCTLEWSNANIRLSLGKLAPCRYRVIGVKSDFAFLKKKNNRPTCNTYKRQLAFSNRRSCVLASDLCYLNTHWLVSNLHEMDSNLMRSFLNGEVIRDANLASKVEFTLLKYD